MAFKALMRGGIYLLFIIGVALKWVMMKMDKSKKREIAEDFLSQADYLPQVDDPITQHTSRDWRVRLSAIHMLSENPDTDQIETLIDHLDDDIYDVREGAASALIAHGKDAVMSSIDVLLTGSLEAREMAVKVLAELHTEVSIAALEQALLEDESAWVRIPAAEALGEIGDEATVPTLIRALDDTHHDVYKAVAKALIQIGTDEVIQATADHPYNDKVKKRRSLPNDDQLQFN